MSAQKGNILIPLLVGALVAALAAAGFFLWQNQQSLQHYPPNKLSPDEIKISGVIESSENDLDVDGYCSVTVDSKTVVIEMSGFRKPDVIPKYQGTIQGISCKNAATDLSSFVGKNLEAYGKWNGYYLTVEGKSDYYIRVN